MGAYDDLPFGSTQSFLYEGGTYSLLPNFPGAASTAAQRINDAGDVVGYFNINNITPPQGFLYSGGNYIALNYPGAAYTTAQGINDNSEVLGISDLGSFIYSGGNYTLLFSGTQIEPFDINDVGDVVGRYERAGVVPLPAALPLLASGLGGIGLVGWWRRRRRGQSAHA